ncbi:MAG: TadE/TadG family type IV pilus assembly protein [Gemmatimonadota bacterium]
MTRRRIDNDRGTITVETAIVTIVLLAMGLGIVEFGNAYSLVHTMTSLSREGANLAARGTSLEKSVDTVLDNGSSIGLADQGGVIATRILVSSGDAKVVEQYATGGYSGLSRMGDVGEDAQEVEDWNLQDGQAVYVMELFYDYEQLTPFGTLVDVAVPEGLYERAVF